MTDEELATRYAAARDPADFRELVERNAPMVLRLVSSVLGPFRDADAEETAQDVFLRVHEKIGQFRGSSKFSTWLYRVAYNVAVNRSRTARLRLTHVTLEALSQAISGDDPLAMALDTETTAAIAAAVDSLPDVYRSAVYLYYWLETPVEEIAILLGAPPNTVKSYLSRARERLGRALREKGFSR